MFSFIKINRLVTSAVIALILALPLMVFASVVGEEAAFVDVEVGHQHYLAIRELKKRGVIEGRENADIPKEEWGFHPGDVVNRAEAMVMIMRSLEPYVPDSSGVEVVEDVQIIEEEVGIDLDFNDVEKGVWFYGDLARAVEEGVISGYEDGTFGAENKVTLAEALTMIMRANEVELPVVIEEEDLFNDVSNNLWYSPYFAIAKEWEILSMTRDSDVGPNDALTRAELAELIYRVIRHRADGAGFGSASYYADRFEGRGTASGAVFTQSAFTAAHPTLPFDTKLMVRNLKNGKSVVVTVNDRGPYGHPGRRLDLSRSAFEAIGSTSSGYIFVEYFLVKE